MVIYNTYAICGFAALGGMLFGFDISSMSGVLGTEAYKQYFHHPRASVQGGITASMPAGSLVGALISPFIADRFSRRAAIQIGGLIFVLGAIIQCSAQNIGHLCAGRVVSGIAIGICSAMVPVYQAEIAPKEIRGRVVSLQQWAITWGILIQYFIQFGAAHVGGGPKDVNQPASAFRIPWGIQAVPAAILSLGLFMFPRSPRWLASKDRWDEALVVLANLHAGGNTNDPKVLAEYEEIKEALRFEREQAISSFRQLAQPRIFKRLVLGMSIQMWSQLCGMNIMMYYIVYIMEGAGIGDALLTASIQYIINVLLTLPAILYLDRVGRRPALLFGSLAMMTCLFISGGLQGAYGQPVTDKNSDISWSLGTRHPSVSKAIVSFSYLFVASFATTWGPTSWTYPSEIFPSKVRAKAVSLSTASNWAWNTILAYAVPPLLWSINWKMYMIFAMFNGLAFIHMFFSAPETTGRTLEEMDEVFDQGIPAWRTNKPTVSRLDNLRADIEAGNLKVDAPGVVGSETVAPKKTEM
ncbi:high affinity glucose transporter [Microthyrium microscopicum]|uniref:High affinity glucose transporter n=1 Tax=Microthyrium microscopicum TaxID=703497 RepID=A0A6A6UMB0_9PEZI|nr:high affinity glucose transporter [Microthyrium microscopicum]